MADYEFEIKSVDAVLVAGIREVLPNYPAVGGLFLELFGYLGGKGVASAGNPITIWYDEGYKPTDVDGEAAVPIAGGLESTDRVKVYALPAVETMVSTVHRGSFATLHDAYRAIMAWTMANGRRYCGPNREVCLQFSSPDQNDPKNVTDIQFPVVRA